MRRPLRAVVALLAAVTAAVLLPAPAHAATIAGWEAADQAREMVARSDAFGVRDGDVVLFLRAWQGLTVGAAGWLRALDDPGMSSGLDGARTDGPARALALAVCGGAQTFAWQITHAEQPGRGDPVFYRPLGSDGASAGLRVGIVVSQTQVVVVRDAGDTRHAATVPRELLFHAQQAGVGDAAVADTTSDVAFCHVGAGFIPASLRGDAGVGAVRLVDPSQVVDTLVWNSQHPRDRDGGGAILRMLQVFAFIPGAGVGALAGLLVFGLAAVHDSSGGIVGVLTTPFAVLRAALTWTFDGTGLHRMLTIAVLVLLGFWLAGLPFAAGLGIAVTVGVTGALQGAVGGTFRPLTWLFTVVWTVASYVVGIVTGIDDSHHVSIVTVALAALGDAAIVVGGSRLVTMTGPVATFGQTVLGRLGGMLSLKPSALAPSGVELSHAAARLVGEGVPLDVAPRTVAEAIANVRTAAIAEMSPWAAAGADVYGVGLRGLDVASWFAWRGNAVTGDVVSMFGELSEWLAGRLGRSQLAHPWVRRLDTLLGHLDPQTRQRVVEVTLPGLRDASQLGSLHSGGQLAGSVLTGATPLPQPALPGVSSVTPADVRATWRAWTVRPAT